VRLLHSKLATYLVLEQTLLARLAQRPVLQASLEPRVLSLVEKMGSGINHQAVQLLIVANQLNLAIYLLPEALYIRLRVPRVVQRDIPAQELQSRVNRLAVGHHPVVAMLLIAEVPA